MAVVKYTNVPTNVVFTKNNRPDASKETHFDAADDQRSTINHWSMFRVANQKLLEPLSGTPSMITTKTKGLLHIDPDPNCVTKACLPAEGIIEALSNHSFFILVTSNPLEQQ